MYLFLQHLKAVLSKDSRILDLGAGEGKQAKFLAAHGKVIAVDRRAATFTHPDIEWHESDIKEWIAANKEVNAYDAIHMRNIIQFFEPEYVRDVLMPAAIRMLKPGGVIAIETFPRDPEPAFVPNRFRSYWHPEDLKAMFSGWQVMEEAEFDERCADLQGDMRHFFMTQLIVRKPESR